MKTIRNGVFETNSSSMHSLAIRLPDAKELDKFNEDESIELYDADGNIIIEMSHYGWGAGDGSDNMHSQYEKLQYLLTMIMETTFNGEKKLGYTNSTELSPSEILRASDGYQKLSAWVSSKCGKNLSNTYEWKKFEWKEYIRPADLRYFLDTDYFIDHQSGSDKYKDLGDFLEKHELDLDKLILDPRLYIYIDNDNH